MRQNWSGRNGGELPVSMGNYIYRITTWSFTSVMKLSLIKQDLHGIFSLFFPASRSKSGYEGHALVITGLGGDGPHSR